MNSTTHKEDMNIVIVGHVDHGKSTVIGRLLADTNSLPEGKLEQVKEMCRRNAKPFEYAFLLDALKDERAQGITIDSARCFFKTQKRDYIIIDAPGHIEFLKNMITGAARAEAALLVIDAKEGVQENSKRHGYMLSMLGIKQISVLVNKMDLVDYDKTVYDNVVKEYTEFLNKINIQPSCFIPVCAMKGDNIAASSDNMPWYHQKTVLQVLDEFENTKLLEEKPFRMPVQDVYKFTKDGDDRRIVAGTIETGTLNVGDEIIFYPSYKKTKVKSVEVFNGNSPIAVSAGYAVGFTTSEQIYIRRGEMAAVAGQLKPQVAVRIKANLFWLGRQPMEKKKSYYLKIGTAKVEVQIEEISNILDASSLNNLDKEQIDRHDVAECILKTDKPVAFDLAGEIAQTSRFVIIDNYEIAGGGIIVDLAEDGKYAPELEDHIKISMGSYKIDITKKSRYALRIMLDIAVHSDGRNTTYEEIAQRQNIDEQYLTEILSQLVKEGLVKDDTNLGAGYVLVKCVSKITVGDILQAFGEKITIVDENMTEYDLVGEVGECLAMSVLEKINMSVNAIVESITLEDLIKQYNKADNRSSIIYYI